MDMKRRETLKSLLLAPLAGGVIASTGCAAAGNSSTARINWTRLPTSYSYGRTETEKLADQKLFAETYFREHELLTEHRLRLREELAVPRLAQFRTWLQSQQAERGGSLLPKSPMGQAIQYALNQRDALCVYTTDGRLNIDSEGEQGGSPNPSENALRRVAVGRKNWLFAGSDNGGRTAATLFSLIATCERHQVEPMAYLRDVLTRIAAMPINELSGLLPDRWKPSTAN